MSSISSEDLNALFNTIVSYSPSNLINFIPPLDLEKQLEQKLAGSTSLKETVEFVLEKCVNTSHPQFVNQLYGGVNPIGLAAAYIVEKMNTNQHTYEVAPVFVVAERLILRQLRLLFFGSEDGDGIFAPGGSFANMYGLITARHERFPNVKQTGLSGLPPLVIFVSEDAHYSGSKMANWMGLGMDNVIKIQTSMKGAMIPAELTAAVGKCRREGKVPLAVMATAGTTVLGAFDPLEEIAEICKAENIWLHLDAAWGGSFIFSERLKATYLRGVDKCDSICWNAHKMLGAPLQCTVFITKKPGVLAPVNSVHAPYLFQPDKHYDEAYDETGNKSVQCGRKADAFKLWLMWAAMGKDGIRDAIEHTEDCARYFGERTRSRDGFMLYLDQGHQCTNVFFWYIPNNMRNRERTEAWWNEIGQVTTKIKKLLLLEDTVMIGYAPLPHKNVPNAFRLVLTAYPPKSFQGMDFIIQSIEAVGERLS